jgi:hypothetical protein
MTKGAVISLRVSEDEQARLREAAEERGTSVSDLVRAVVLREVNDSPTGGVVASSTATPAVDGWQGPFWNVAEGVTVAGATVTLSP